MEIGNDDPRSQDERDSDGGELSSPASQDHQNKHYPFHEEADKSVQSSFFTEENSVGVEGNVEGTQNTSVENEIVVEIQREVNLEKETKSVIEFLKVSHNGDDKSSSSSSSSSDDESQAFDEKQKVESHNAAPVAVSFVDVEKVEEVREDSTNEKPLTEAKGNSVTETAPAMDCEIPVTPMSDLANYITEGAMEVLDVIESKVKENEDKLLPISDVVAGLVPEVNKENVFPIPNQNAEASTVAGPSDILNGKEDELPESSSSQTSYAENIKDSEYLSVAHTSEVGKDIKKTEGFKASEDIETQVLPLVIFYYMVFLYLVLNINMCLFSMKWLHSVLFLQHHK